MPDSIKKYPSYGFKQTKSSQMVHKCLKLVKTFIYFFKSEWSYVLIGRGSKSCSDWTRKTT